MKHQNLPKESSGPAMQVIPMHRDKYVLNITAQMQDRSIQNAERGIADARKEIEELLPEYNEKKNVYELAYLDYGVVQSKMDHLSKEIQEQQNLIDVYKFFKSKKGDKIIRVNKPSEEAKTRKGYKRRVNWLKEIYEILHREDRFMDFETLWSIISRDKALVSKYDGVKTKFSHIKTAVIRNIIKHANFHGKSRNGVQYLAIYKEKFGLAEWVDAKTKSLVFPRHLKGFMQE